MILVVHGKAVKYSVSAAGLLNLESSSRLTLTGVAEMTHMSYERDPLGRGALSDAEVMKVELTPLDATVGFTETPAWEGFCARQIKTLQSLTKGRGREHHLPADSAEALGAEMAKAAALITYCELEGDEDVQLPRWHEGFPETSLAIELKVSAQAERELSQWMTLAATAPTLVPTLEVAGIDFSPPGEVFAPSGKATWDAFLMDYMPATAERYWLTFPGKSRQQSGYAGKHGKSILGLLRSALRGEKNPF